MLLEKDLTPPTDRSLGALGPVEGPSNGVEPVINTHYIIRGYDPCLLYADEMILETIEGAFITKELAQGLIDEGSNIP